MVSPSLHQPMPAPLESANSMDEFSKLQALSFQKSGRLQSTRNVSAQFELNGLLFLVALISVTIATEKNTFSMSIHRFREVT